MESTSRGPEHVNTRKKKIQEMLWKPWSWLYAVCFLDLFGASMIMPVFSSYLRSLEISHMKIGLLSSLYGAAQLISGPIVGSWSDINGRAPVLWVSMIVCSVSYSLLGIVSSFYFFIIIRCILGSFKHTQTLSRAFVADIVPEEDQSSVHGLMNAFTSFSFTIGPVISGHVMEMKNGFQYLTTVVMLIFIFNATIVYSFANNTSNYNRREPNKNKLTEKFVLVFQELYSIKWGSFWELFSVKFLFALSGILFFQNMGVILTESFGIPHRYMGYTVSFYGFISVISNVGVGKLKDSRVLPSSHLTCLGYTFFIMTVTFCLLFVIDNYILFVIAIVPLSSSHALSRILLTEVLLEQSDPINRGSVVGVSSSISAMARILAPFLSGFIITWAGVTYTLLFSSFISASTCVLIIKYSLHPHNKHLKTSKKE